MPAIAINMSGELSTFGIIVLDHQIDQGSLIALP